MYVWKGLRNELSIKNHLSAAAVWGNSRNTHLHLDWLNVIKTSFDIGEYIVGRGILKSVAADPVSQLNKLRCLLSLDFN